MNRKPMPNKFIHDVLIDEVLSKLKKHTDFQSIFRYVTADARIVAYQ